MDEFELDARRSTRGLYDVPFQHERDEFMTETSEEGPQMESSISMSKPFLATTESRGSTTKLPPKSFRQVSLAKRIWMHIITAVVGLIFIGIPIGVFIQVLITGSNESQKWNATYCTIGSAYEDPESNSFSSFFNIDTVYGRMSFGTAKFIDLVWDVGVSRCGQAMLVWITYRINTSALLRIMETQPVSYEFFSSFSLSQPSLACFIPAIKSFFTHLGFRNKLSLFWIMISVIWVAFWPLITNAMTGYVAENNTLVKIQGEDGYIDIGNLTSVSHLAFQLASFPERGPLLLNTGPDVPLWNNIYQSFLSKTDSDDRYEVVFPYNSSQWTTSAYTLYYYQSQVYDPRTYFGNPENVQCVATGIYQWGFSIFILAAFMFINAFWIFGTYGVWVHMNRKSELCRKGRRLGQYRAAVDLVESIQKDLGKNICAYSEEELREQLEKIGGIKYYVDQDSGDRPPHIGISSSRDKGPPRLRFGEVYG